MASEKINAIVEEVGQLTVLELSELVSARAQAQAQQQLRRRQSLTLFSRMQALRRSRLSRLFVRSQVSVLRKQRLS